MAENTSQQGILFDERFLEKHAGSIISNPSVAIVELIANSWDAYATKVDIIWPNRKENTPFKIIDNGKGITPEQFERCWKTLDYNRLEAEGEISNPPPELKAASIRKVYGRNGKGRHAAFHFSNPYHVCTWRDGIEVTYEVYRGANQPFAIKEIKRRENIQGHGTEITATASDGVNLDPDSARAVIGTRFLVDPNFQVTLNGITITFDDIPNDNIKQISVPVDPYGTTEIIMIDNQKADKTTKQHGIAWRVNSRLVGNPGWTEFDHNRFLDGRTTEAKRVQFIVIADFLQEAVKADWTGFLNDNEVWEKTRTIVHDKIKELLFDSSEKKRQEIKKLLELI